VHTMSQDEAPATLCLSMAQSLHAVAAPLAENCPAGHGTHCMYPSPSTKYCPALQHMFVVGLVQRSTVEGPHESRPQLGVQLLLPAELECPTAHILQAVSPAVSRYVPLTHVAQSSDVWS